MSSFLPAAPKSTARDMTQGPIAKQIIQFSLPLMLGNVFQMLYNTVDSIVVGKYVSFQALAAVGATTMIINMMVFFFNGFSTGAGVIIGQRFGARNMKSLHIAIETAMATTFLLSVLFSIGGVLTVRPLLRLMSTPADVMDEATIYLQIYIAGISGLLIYNMCSGILRAVGDTTRPLYFLILTSVVNILLDLFFVLICKAGIAGVAYATIIAQFISAGLTLRLLTCTKDIYRLTWHDLKIDWPTLRQIFAVGLPAGIQSVLTAFSNVFVQSYINFFGSECMAGWSSYNKLDQFIILPMQSMAMASTTFVSQNFGANQDKRANRGAVITVAMSTGMVSLIAVILYILAVPAIGLFTNDAPVIAYGVLFVHTNNLFLPFHCIDLVLAGALRGRGDSRGPMVIMLTSFVGLRQLYLYLITHFVANTPQLVGFGYPVGWIIGCVLELTYFYFRWNRKSPQVDHL